MNLIGNVIWLIFGGFIACIEYLIAGVILCCTVIGIPWGLQCFKIAMLILAPFGRKVIPVNNGMGCLSTFFNVIWLFIGGFWICITHLVFGVLLAITIIGLPFANQHFKLAGLALTPFGKEIH
jgi:uncharacterized membrane protein YccF (DUF307 family)